MIKTTTSMATGAAVAVLFGMLSTGAANADTFVPLPDGQTVGPGGVTVTRTGETAVVSPSLAANGVGRVVWVSGTVMADVADTAINTTGPGPFVAPNNGPGTNNSSTHGVSQLNTGYLIGCQVSIGTSAISAGGGLSVSTSNATLSGSVSIQLGPGQVAFVQTAFKDIYAPGTVSIGYKDNEINIQGCAGYAQARAYTNVEIIGENYSKTTLYGQPFSIG